ncbi:MAG: DUF3261 domain-containing protein [Gammaproteobacteria bacterium]|nr:DUF3261 domain-containing protein [Gammaproteobacteria bacterium]MBU6508776.1 DUF3261 domain-containing protein [Gammaproteobacteria bacterium]MDE1983226.1 DUF3261 domain-containing protein [Gammaproteobacteria bacterium]MDE2108719.1 DUF3261 domain-containing protein [Gammaproteobacteria bacterium]MDE2459773.1 DUF3261 domain-containing protein [Gammaproteobacteria bacterium]
MKSGVTLILATLGLLAGCASLPPAPGCTRLGPDGVFCALPPAALPAVSATHLVTVTHAGESQSFIGRLQIDDRHLRLAGLSLFGTELFTLDYDGRQLTSHSAGGKLRPELLLAMLELTLAPAAELPPQLRNLSLSVSTEGQRQVRELTSHGRLVARIEISGSRLSTADINIVIPSAQLALQLAPLAAAGPAP